MAISAWNWVTASTAEPEPRPPTRSYGVLGRRVHITRKPRRPRQKCDDPIPLVRLVLIIGAAISLSWIMWHEFTYRQTGGDDFEYGIISHAGADMLVQFLFTFGGMIGALLVVQLIQDRGVRR